jgi:hypothetical protein
MDPNNASDSPVTAAPKAARVALNVLALCFALSVLGRGLGESFTVFLLPISESFGWDRAQVVSVYSLTALAGGLASPLIGRLFDRSWSPPMPASSGNSSSASAFASGLASPSSATSRIPSCSAAGSARDCRPRWRSSIPRPAPVC